MKEHLFQKPEGNFRAQASSNSGQRWQIGSGRSFKGRMFTVGRWWVWLNCHTRWTLRTSYRHSPNFGRPVRSLVILGCELSWGRA